MNYHAATGPLVPSAPLPITSDMDKMFTDLGLETFVSKTAAGGTDVNKATAIPSSVSSSSLTLEDKQRMVRQQEQSQRLQNSTELVAKPVISTRVAQKPIDLTSKLIDSNLNQIKSPTASNNTSNWMGSSSGNNAGAAEDTTNWGAMTSSSSGGNWNGNFAGFNSMPSGGSMMPQQQQQQQQPQWGAMNNKPTNPSNNNNENNWSALDNLLPAKQKTPMNQLVGGQQTQSLLMPHSQASAQGPGMGGSSKQGTNQLSQQDIMEFLG